MFGLLWPHNRHCSGPTNGRRDAAAAHRPPFPHLSRPFERRESVKGALFLRGLRTLDRFPPFEIIRLQGKGAGGLRGLAPWRSMRQRLITRPQGRAPPQLPSCSVGSLATRTAFCRLSPARHCRHASIRTLFAAVAAVPIGVLNSRGAAISESI